MIHGIIHYFTLQKLHKIDDFGDWDTVTMFSVMQGGRGESAAYTAKTPDRWNILAGVFPHDYLVRPKSAVPELIPEYSPWSLSPCSVGNG